MLKRVLVASALGLSAVTLSAVGTPSIALPAVGLEAPSGPAVPIAWRGHHGRFHAGPRFHRFGHFRRGRVFYGGPVLVYGSGCAWLRHRALVTGSPYWWRRYRACRYGW
jgi:hypothetical protein